MTVTDLGPREVRHPSGPELRRTRIVPLDYTASRLIAELADAWKDYCEAMELSPGTVSSRACPVRHVGAYLTADTDRFLTLTDPGTSTLSRLHEWECAAISRFPPPSGRAKDLGEAIRRCVRYFLHGAGIDSSPLATWAAGRVLDSSTPSAPPLDEFSNRERLSLQRRLRQIVRDGEKLLALGEELLATGVDPGKHGWGRIGNVLWGLRHSPRPDRGSSWLSSLAFDDIAEQVRQATGITLERRSPQAATFLLLTPSDHHLSALRTLIHLRTGWAPEETKWLTRDDLQFTDSEVRVRTVKNRAGRRRWHTLALRAETAPGWGAGELFRRAKEAMRHAHALSADQEWFWACGGGPSPVGVPVMARLSVRRCSFNGRSSLAGLARAYDIDLSAPVDLRRIRKTVKSVRAVLLGTLHGAAAGDHSVEVFRNHYLPTTTVNTIAARTVIGAQAKVLRRATTGPTLIPADAASIAAAASENRIGELAKQVAQERESERDLTIAACTDPYRPPHTTGRQLCMAGPSMCLRCPNAVVFADHLPRLLGYRQVLDEHQRSLPPPQFHELFGQQLANLRAIIDTFPPEKVRAAAAQHTDVHIPLPERHQHR